MATTNGKEIGGSYVVVLSVVSVGILFLLTGDVGLDLGDEGHLWYGALQTAGGAIPLRDFRSYDPGRYFWAAGWSFLFGPGIVALRVANALIQALGVGLGLLSVRRVVTHRGLFALVGAMLALWMIPRHKVYEHTMALAAVWCAVRLIEKPSLARHLVAGVVVGIAAFFGRNFGVYLGVSFAGLSLLLGRSIEPRLLARKLAFWSLGMAAGYSPMLLLAMMVPGFASSLVDSIVALFGPSAPVLPRPIPWPWTLSPGSLLSWQGPRMLGISLAFVLVPTAYLFALICALRRPNVTASSGLRLVLAGAFVGIPLMHHAMVRSDLAHVAQAIHPFLITAIALPVVLPARRAITLGVGGFLVAFTGVLAAPLQLRPALDKLRAQSGMDAGLIRSDLRGDRVWLAPEKAAYVGLVENFVEQNVEPDESILFAPYEPGLYAICKRRSPVWDPYPLFPEGAEGQRHMIRSMAEYDVTWALVSDRPLERWNPLRFSQTHPLVWDHLMDEFDEVALPGLPQDRLLLRRREAHDASERSHSPAPPTTPRLDG